MSITAEANVSLDVFARLQESAELVARHPDFPGKRSVEATILLEIDDLHRAGKLDDDQRSCLRSLLNRRRASH